MRAFGGFPPLPPAGQDLTVRYGEVAEEGKVSYYTVQIRRDDGSPLNLRMSYPVQDALFGPPYPGSPERQRWDALRDQRRRERKPPATNQMGSRYEAWLEDRAAGHGVVARYRRAITNDAHCCAGPAGVSMRGRWSGVLAGGP
jgi:hypothetical protein